MKTTQRTLLAIAIGSLSTVAMAEPASQEFVPITVKSTNAQSEATGFVEGQSLSGTTRNFFAKEQFKRGGGINFQKGDGSTERTTRRDTWTQGTIVNYTSGFTQGTVGFAVEGALYNEIALEQGRARIAGGSNRTLADHDGDAVDQWSKLGLGNIKARYSNTVLTAGRQTLNTPMVATIGNRALPSSFEGLSLHSAELENLTFDAGTFDRVSPRTEQSLTKFVSEYGDRSVTADHVSTLGAVYKPFKSVEASLYATRVEDLWNQYYFGLTHELGDADVLALTTSLNYYKTKDEGASKLGDIDNNTYSLSFTGTHGAHSLTLAYQEVDGNEYFDYLHETNGIFLANSLLSDFNGPNEKSFQVAYGLNMAEYGVPGLKFNIYTARGWDIDGRKYKGGGYDGVQSMADEHHYEYGVGTSYAVQSGPLKATTIRATYTTHRASENQVDGSLNELRLVTTVPFNIL
ncbi:MULTISPECIES: OprD family porin [Pseudomonas]|uniref:OprD family porin n=1 Tax=Pseudomonas quercus TaxID=2722792 RepID=A0ABX0YDC9_9PSED|nr:MULTISPECIES: OprD family porin [Pseudomonas]MBF7142862.1 OprD family porin [Pseudomonas sp. LY10J]NJP01410.1 OprD family porin [Pseudomonas quercus]